jgi:electron transport complex protein RnfC
MRRRLWRFPGGIRLPGHKATADAEGIEAVALPDRIVLPLRQHAGRPAVATVAAGERVLAGELVGRGEGFVSANVHASTSGTVTAIEAHPIAHPSGLTAPCVVIEPDGEDRWVETAGIASPWTAPVSDLLQRIRDAGIVGLGGATFPAAAKLKPTRPIDTLILNGVECEPYISCDDRLMRTRAGDVLRAGLLLRRMVEAPAVTVAVEDNKPEALAALGAALPEVLAEHPGVALEVVAVPTRFPAGGERQLIKVLTGREVPSGGLPYEVGVVCTNVGTGTAAFDAVIRGRPLVSRIVTVAGEALPAARNFEVRLGTSVAHLVAAAGGDGEGEAELRVGGPMMGFPLNHPEAPIAKGSNCILVRPSAARPPATALPCIRCGACADACPIRLLPQQLYWHARGRELDKAEAHHLFDCIECGCCTHVCPARIPLVDYFRFAKHAVREERRRKEQAAVSRQRNQQRKHREERAAREKAARKARGGKAKAGGAVPRPAAEAPAPRSVPAPAPETS